MKLIVNEEIKSWNWYKEDGLVGKVNGYIICMQFRLLEDGNRDGVCKMNVAYSSLMLEGLME